MRKINPHDFKVARRGTSREINRQIALNLVRAHQPISRADLARLMNVRRGVASLLVSELLDEGLIFEGAVGEAVGRGRSPPAPDGQVDSPDGDEQCFRLVVHLSGDDSESCHPWARGASTPNVGSEQPRA